VLTNPPFFTPGATRVSPEPGRASAHHMAGDLKGWVSGVLTLLAPKGQAVMIHRADHIEAVLAAFSGRFGAITLRFVHPRAQEVASRLIIAGIKGSRAPLSVLPPLMLHAGEGFTPLVKALHEGRERLSTRV
jgi:tRNA1(Val) A37 N6-methylase TrmN6